MEPEFQRIIQQETNQALERDFTADTFDRIVSHSTSSKNEKKIYSAETKEFQLDYSQTEDQQGIMMNISDFETHKTSSASKKTNPYFNSNLQTLSPNKKSDTMEQFKESLFAEYMKNSEEKSQFLNPKFSQLSPMGASKEIEMLKIRLVLLAIENTRLVTMYKEKNQECDYLAKNVQELIEYIQNQTIISSDTHSNSKTISFLNTYTNANTNMRRSKDETLQNTSGMLLKEYMEELKNEKESDIFMIKSENERLQKKVRQLEKMSLSNISGSNLNNQNSILGYNKFGEQQHAKETKKLHNKIIEQQNQSQSLKDELDLKNEEIKILKIEISGMRTVIEKLKNRLVEHEESVQSISRSKIETPKFLKNSIKSEGSRDNKIRALEEAFKDVSQRYAYTMFDMLKQRKEYEVIVTKKEKVIQGCKRELCRLLASNQYHITANIDLLDKYTARYYDIYYGNNNNDDDDDENIKDSRIQTLTIENSHVIMEVKESGLSEGIKQK